MLGGGGGLGQTLMTAGPAATVGMTTGSPTAAAAAMIPGLVGAGAKTATNVAARKEMRLLDELLRSRSPLAEKTMVPSQVYAPGAMPSVGGRALAAQLSQTGQGGRLAEDLQRGAPMGGMTPEQIRRLLAQGGT